MKTSAYVYLLLTILSITCETEAAKAQRRQSELYRDESAASARAAMGLLANGYARAFTASVFGLRANTLPCRIASAAVAAAGYQLLSFDAEKGVRVDPTNFRKQWKGYWTGYFAAEGLDVFLHLFSKYNGVKFFIGSTFAAATGIMIVEGESRQTWRYAHDGPLTLRKLLTNRNSYWIHFAGSGGLYWALLRHTRSEELALAYSAALIWLWEVKDGYVWYEDVGFLGGDGFSWADGLAGSIAAAGSYLVSKVLILRVRETHRRFRNRRAGRAQRRGRRLQFVLGPRGAKIRLRLDF